MSTLEPVVQRYRRTDQDRLGDWAPVDASWKSAASAGLVAHDLYHHLPTDTGTFAEELASLGAEWYVDVQALPSSRSTPVQAWPIDSFRRNVDDTILNALDSQEEWPFDLPLFAEPAPALSAAEMELFRALAATAEKTLEDSHDERSVRRDGFQERFVQTLLWGYAQARARFPDQQAVRKASRELAFSLANLELADVPIGHEVTVTLLGYDANVTYGDADADFLHENEVLSAYLMTWCSGEAGYPAKHVCLYARERDFAEHVQAHFDRESELALSPAECLMPEGPASALRPVYVRDATLQEQLLQGRLVTLPLTLMHMSDFTPRGVRVI